jgi:hypothetical protein
VYITPYGLLCDFWAGPSERSSLDNWTPKPVLSFMTFAGHLIIIIIIIIIKYKSKAIPVTGRGGL